MKNGGNESVKKQKPPISQPGSINSVVKAKKMSNIQSVQRLKREPSRHSEDFSIVNSLSSAGPRGLQRYYKRTGTAFCSRPRTVLGTIKAEPARPGHNFPNSRRFSKYQSNANIGGKFRSPLVANEDILGQMPPRTPNTATEEEDPRTAEKNEGETNPI